MNGSWVFDWVQIVGGLSHGVRSSMLSEGCAKDVAFRWPFFLILVVSCRMGGWVSHGCLWFLGVLDAAMM